MAYTAWRGAIEITVGGFPIPVHVALQPRAGAIKGQGFSLMSPDGQPVQQRYVSADETWSGSIGECARGIDGVKLDDDVVKQIGESERDSSVEPESFAPLSSIDLSLSMGAYTVVPDKKIAGAEKSASIVWNGLRHGDLAYITRIVMRAGGVDRYVAIYAAEEGLRAVALPFVDEVKDEPSMTYVVDENVGEMFVSAIADSYPVQEFAPGVSVHRERRQQLIDQALAGQAITVAKPAPKADTPDLMAALAAAMEQPVKKPKTTKTTKTKKDKVAA
jgi:non-homologous end joining protein Ku